MKQVYFSGLLAPLVPFWFFPASQIIEKLPAASLFTPNLQRARLLFLVGLCCYILGLYLDCLNSSNSMERFSAQFPIVEKSSKYVVGTLLPGFGYWESALPSVLIFWWASGLCWGHSPYSREKWQTRCFREEGRVEWEPLHLRAVHSHSPQGSVFEVSGIRGPCFFFFNPITPLF